MTTPHPHLEDLIDVVATLLGEGGCPWDQEQTHQSLAPYLLEEVFELIEALETGSQKDIAEELGDVLYQVVFHTTIAAAHPREPFNIDDVAQGVARKMRERHPHVFENPGATTVAEVKAGWETIKAQQKGHRTSVLEGIPGKLSALARAQSVMSRSAALQGLVTPGAVEKPETPEQFGSLLLHLVAQAHSLGINAESALRHATREFEQQVTAREQTPPGLASTRESD
jgi:XTP/dITP diphosphohydrolase